MKRIHIIVGESGSGKSYYSRNMLKEAKGQMVRLNRDEMRLMLHSNESKGRKMEDFVVACQVNMACHALSKGLHVIIDDTNLNENTQERWKHIAAQHGADFVVHRMDTPLEVCIARDRQRENKVGAAVIYRQFLDSGRLKINIDPDLPIVIVDVDGTLALNDGHRGWYDEDKVLGDKCYDHIATWVASLYADHTVYIVSGRHSTCGEDTITWLDSFGIPFDGIFMRHAWDERDDCIVKKEILDSLLKLVPRSQIKMVLDDRPKVIRMWREQGLMVIPVQGACEEF